MHSDADAFKLSMYMLDGTHSTSFSLACREDNYGQSNHAANAIKFTMYAARYSDKSVCLYVMTLSHKQWIVVVSRPNRSEKSITESV